MESNLVALPYKNPLNTLKFDLALKFDIKCYICYIIIKVIFGIFDMTLEDEWTSLLRPGH